MGAPLHSSPMPTWGSFCQVGGGKQPNSLSRVRGHGGGTPGGLHTHTHTYTHSLTGGDPSRRPHLPGRAARAAAASLRRFRANLQSGEEEEAASQRRASAGPGASGAQTELVGGGGGQDRMLPTLGVSAEGAELPQAGLHGVSGRQDLGSPPLLSLPPRCAPGSLQNAGGVPGQRRHLTGSPRRRTPHLSRYVSLNGTPEAGTRPSGGTGAARGAEASPWGTRRPRSAAGCGRAANGVSAPTALPAPTSGGRAASRVGIPPSAGLSGALRARMGAAAAPPQPLSLQNRVRARIPPAAPARASAAPAGLRAASAPDRSARPRAAPAPYGAPNALCPQHPTP